MTVRELRHELYKLDEQDREVVLYDPDIGHTTDILLSVDDNNDVGLYVVGGAKPFISKQEEV